VLEDWVRVQQPEDIESVEEDLDEAEIEYRTPEE
jgi:hypothetical protein